MKNNHQKPIYKRIFSRFIHKRLLLKTPSYSVVFHAGKAGVLKDEKIVFLPLYFACAFARFGMDDKMKSYSCLADIILQYEPAYKSNKFITFVL